MHTTTDGVEIHVREQGSGDPVLLLHAFPLSSAMWAGTMERLGDRWRLIAPDFRGHGESGASEHADIPRMARDQVELLDAMQVREPVVLVGLSMGGYVAFEILRRWPERVRALVLADTRAEADAPEAAANRLAVAERVLREGSEGFAEEMAGKLFSPAAPTEVRSEWSERMGRTSPVGVAAAQRGMATRPDSTTTLQEWREPLLVIVGEEDALTPPELARRMHDLVPGSRLEVIQGAGHIPPVERPEAFASVLGDFLDELPPRR
jgi:3-oxoadipate enol-lactonase